MTHIVVSPVDLHPLNLLRADGTPRRVGVEVEFLGPSARKAAEALAHHLCGSLEMEDPHAFKIRSTRFGDLSVETDLRYVHPQRHPELGALRLSARMAAGLGTMIMPLVPRELITAPVSVSQLPELDGVLAILREAGAYGRGAVLLDSLGLHFNIDPPSLDAVTLTAYLKAYLLVSDRLREEIAGGNRRLRRALPPDYPSEYRRRVLATDYWPSLEHLTADYLGANPTRKRGLDFLPVLAHLSAEPVRAALPGEKIAPRPVFHYRLPQAHLSDPEWGIMPDWGRWLLVEQLAADLLVARSRAGVS